MRGWSLLALCIVLIASPPIPINAIPSQGFYDPDYYDSYIARGPINITCNEDFTTQGWNGTGSYEDPFLISDLNITSDSHCISVSNTTASFVVSECLLTSVTKSPYSIYEDLIGAGLYLSNVSNCIIERCYINWKYHGIFSFNSSECTYKQNVIQMNMWDGIRLIETGYSNISRNSIYDNGGSGIYLKESPHLMINQNAIRDNSESSSIAQVCDNSSFIDNEVSDSEDGFYVIYSDDVNILSNSFNGVHRGLILAQGKGFNVINNTVSSAESHAISLHMIESSTFVENSVESSQTGYRIDDAVQCYFSENYLHLNDRGILATRMMNCLFTNNTFSENYEYAVWFDQDSSENEFYWNDLSGDSEFFAKDVGSSNLWDDNVSLGNDWGDYQGYGAYIISGMSGSIDRYPEGFRADFTPLLFLQGIGAIGICAILILGAYKIVTKKRKLPLDVIELNSS